MAINKSLSKYKNKGDERMKNDLRKELKTKEEVMEYLVDAIDTFLEDEISKNIKIEMCGDDICISLNRED